MSKKHIAFCINDGYAQYVAVTIRSIVENNREDDICIHIITDGLDDSNIDLLNMAADSKTVKIYTVDDSSLKGLKDSWSIYTWYRLLLPSILKDVKKVLYLDADTIIDNNLNELFEFPMEGHSVAGVIDCQAFDSRATQRLGKKCVRNYCCAGVLMMNLDFWRAHSLAQRIIDWARENEKIIRYPDQDAINYVCADSKTLLPIKYGVLDIHFYSICFRTEKLRQEALEALKNPVIIHYGGTAPWCTDGPEHHFTRRWEYYESLLGIHAPRIKYKERNITMKVKLRRWLDRIGIWPMKVYFIRENMTDEGLKEHIANGELMPPFHDND